MDSIFVMGPLFNPPVFQMNTFIVNELNKWIIERTNISEDSRAEKQSVAILYHLTIQYVVISILITPFQQIGDELRTIDVVNEPVRPRNGRKILISLNDPLSV